MRMDRMTRRDVLRRTGQAVTAAPFLGLAACGPGAGRDGPIVLTGATMGTTYSIALADPPAGVDPQALQRDVDRLLETVNAQMSTYRPDSELSRFNAAPPTGWVAVSPETAAVVAHAIEVGLLSAGAFDATVGALVNRWGFGPPDRPAELPAAPLAGGGRQVIEARLAPPALRKARAGVLLDLCGIAKGFGLDRIAAHLEAAGIENYLIEIGGELRARGRSPRGGPWRIGIERPVPGEIALQRIVRLGHGALATSGDYRHFYERDGRRYSHLIDPRTGAPVAHDLASVSVISDSAMAADAMSTALMVMGPDAGVGLAERHRLAALFIVRREGGLAEISTPQFDRYLVL